MAGFSDRPKKAVICPSRGGRHDTPTKPPFNSPNRIPESGLSFTESETLKDRRALGHFAAMSAHASKRTLYAALAANAGIAIAKFLGAAYTGSSAMMSEGVHSIIDTGNQRLLLYGLRDANSLGRRSSR